jgi:hypothetical protein
VAKPSEAPLDVIPTRQSGVEVEYLVNNACFGVFGYAIERDRVSQSITPPKPPYVRYRKGCSKGPELLGRRTHRGGRMSEVKKLSIIDDYADINRRLSQLQPKKGVAPAKKTACSMCLDVGWVWDTKGRT